ncbi:MAG: class I SAM-dependent methyltransferase [Verrucomicrobiota bacterium]
MTPSPPAPIDLQAISQGLARDTEGIWRAAQSERVSYLEEGNALCFELEEKSFWFAHRNACLNAVVRRFPPAGTIFDIGGGNGYVAQSLISAGFETVLLEPGESGVRNAAQRGLPHVICGTLKSAQFEDRSLPAAAIFDVLEHVEDDAGFLKEIARCLVDRGRLYITVPSYEWLWSHDDVTAGHFRRYTLSQLEGRLRAAGFTPLFASYFFAFVPLPLFLMRSLPSLFGRRSLTQRSYKNLHRSDAGVLLGRTLAFERRRIERGATVPIGSSCLLVAEKR